MKISLGQRVVNSVGIRGTVVGPLLLGSEPFQVAGDNGLNYSFITEDGIGVYSGDLSVLEGSLIDEFKPKSAPTAE